MVANVVDDILTLENLLKVQSALAAEWKKSQAELGQSLARERKDLVAIQKQIRNYIDAIGRNAW